MHKIGRARFRRVLDSKCKHEKAFSSERFQNATGHKIVLACGARFCYGVPPHQWGNRKQAKLITEDEEDLGEAGHGDDSNRFSKDKDKTGISNLPRRAESLERKLSATPAESGLIYALTLMHTVIYM